MKIAGLQKNSTIDFPGKLSCVVFTAGCNYDCYFCHNRHLLGAEAKIADSEFFQFLEKRKGLIDGVVITGGEPSLYSDLPDFIGKIKVMGYEVKLDTNGSNPLTVRKLIDESLLDFIAIDYKAPFGKYDLIRACGNIEENEMHVKNTINMVMDSDIDYEIRTTMIPEIGEDDIISMAGSFPAFKSYALQKYRPVPEDSGFGKIFYSAADLERIADNIRNHQPNTLVRA